MTTYYSLGKFLLDKEDSDRDNTDSYSNFPDFRQIIYIRDLNLLFEILERKVLLFGFGSKNNKVS